MIKDTWVSIDLDYWAPLSWKRGKRISFDRFLKSIPNNIRCFLTIEHHEVLRPLRKAIKEGDLSLPMNIIHVDTHHDYYFNIARGKKIDCGNFMWKIPQKWYKQFRWYQPHFPEEWDWEKAQEKLKNKTKVCNEKPKINWSRVGLITFTLSPDYCEELIYKAEKMIEAITKKFNLNRTIEKRDAKSDNSVESWGYKLLKG